MKELNKKKMTKDYATHKNAEIKQSSDKSWGIVGCISCPPPNLRKLTALYDQFVTYTK